MSSYGTQCKQPTGFPECGPRCKAVLPKFHECECGYSSFWFLLFLFRAVLLLEKEANSLHSGAHCERACAPSRAAGYAVHWRKAETLDGRSAGPGAASCGEGNLGWNCSNRGGGSVLLFLRFCVAFDLLHVSVGHSGCRRSCVVVRKSGIESGEAFTLDSSWCCVRCRQKRGT